MQEKHEWVADGWITLQNDVVTDNYIGQTVRLGFGVNKKTNKNTMQTSLSESLRLSIAVFMIGKG